MIKGMDTGNPRETFKFLDEKTANEPHILEVLSEILSYQMQSLPGGEQPLATMDTLKKSSKIKIPFTTTRDRTIIYLVELLLKRYSHFVRPIVSFEFRVEESSKKIDIVEKTEYTVLLNNKDYEQLRSVRDKKSMENLLDLLKKYRFFNLSKLIKRAAEKAELSRLIKKELGKRIFTFKNYNIDDSKVEWAEDFCFHVENYDSVKDSLNLKTLKDIISNYNVQVKRALNKFGILNADFSDYRDSKLSYIFSILTDDLSSSISERDLVHVKNIHSLISCLNKVEKVIDPVLTISDDIVKFIREHKITTEMEIINTLPELDNETLRKWASQDNLRANKIIMYTDTNEETYFIDGLNFFNMISEHNQLLLFQPEKLGELSHAERRKIKSRMELFYEISVNLFNTGDNLQDFIKIDDEKIQTLRKILDDYEKYKKKLTSKNTQEASPKPVKKTSVFKAISGFFKSLFGSDSKKGGTAGSGARLRSKSDVQKEISSETTKVYKKTADMNAPLIPLSDFVELTPENDYMVDKIIREMRDNNLKIIVPIYNARHNLYPKRSQKLLLPDVEYLLVAPEKMKSPNTIREFTNSLVGFKIKDEPLPANAVITIEKYMLSLYRQQKAAKQ